MAVGKYNANNKDLFLKFNTFCVAILLTLSRLALAESVVGTDLKMGTYF